ncbi:MAG: signal peptidase II [Ruminococcus sp.]|nr:signal peptidase II [Ruminococcus sp.]
MIISIISAILIVILDQISKWLIVANMNLGESINVIPGLLDFTYFHNDGMALGIGSSAFRWVFIIITVLICGVLIYLMSRPQYKNKLFFAATACVVGGGIGNLIDRVFNGYVVDFLALSFFPPVCNIADYFITAGTVMLMVYIVFYYGKNPKTTNKAE